MRALLDINVLIALLDSDHSLHSIAITWFTQYGSEGWASCPITQNGCLRIMSHSAYPNPLPVKTVLHHLRDACANSVHEFWSDSVSLLDSKWIDPSTLLTSAQLTDVYLLALATAHRGKLVTFDRSILLQHVKAAQARNLVVL